MEQTPQAKGSGKSTGAIIVAILVIVVVVILWAVNSSTRGTGESPTASENSGQPTFNGQLSKTDQEKELTKSVELPAGPSGIELSSLKAYEVKMEKGSYDPSELIVAKGGRVQISMVAVDADYDVVFAAPLGVYLNVKQGQAAVFGFDASDDKAGEYLFTCKDSCPAGGAMQGRLVIK